MNFRFLRRAALIAASGFSVTAVAVPAIAADEGQNVSRTVRLADLNLQSTAGATAAASRIRIAAAYVCGGENVLVLRTLAFARCRSHAIDRALDQLNEPLVASAMGRNPPTEMARR